jgi:ASPIC and UnbV/FG-GAP-like repeat
MSTAVARPTSLLSSLHIPGYVDRAGLQFFETGSAIVGILDALANLSRRREFRQIETLFANEYRGESLGLRTLCQTNQWDGIVRSVFSSDRSPADKTAAVAEWRDYFDCFASIEECGLHVHRLEDWGETREIRATVRFEVIGKPLHAPLSGIDRGYLRMRFARTTEGLKIAGASLEQGDRVIADRPQFRNVAADAGVDFVNRYYPGYFDDSMKFKMLFHGPAGITVVDYDNDGFYDLFIPDGVESKLFRNRRDGTFEDVTARAGLAGLDGVSVAVFADYDNDGFKDLFVSRTFRPNQLFHNNGDGTFTDVTKESGIGEDSCTTVASWADYDNDGFLDLYVGRYLDPREDIPTTFYARNGLPNQLYHNNGDGTFTNVTEKAGVGDPGLCLGTVFGDYNDDGYPDLYVVNDFGRKTLYRNNCDGTFTDVTVRAGALAYGAGMSASFADYDNDGKLDIYCTNIRSEHAWYAEAPTVNRYMVNSWRQGVWKTDMPLYFQVFRQSGLNFVKVYQQMASGNTLLRNKGDGTFEDTTWQASANPVGWFWGASFGDFNNDGWQDIYAADGWVYNEPGTELELEFLNNVVTRQKVYKSGLFFDPVYFGRRSWHGYERNRHLRNNGDGTFTEVGRAAGTDLVLNSRGVAVADFWNRGVLDIAVAASADRHALLRNEADTGRHWLQIELVGVQSNRDAVGARVTAIAKGKLQMREVVLGDGYGSQNSLRQHFGLGEATHVDELTVNWPRSGVVQKFHNVAADRIVEITEGTDLLVEKRYGRPASR